MLEVSGRSFIHEIASIFARYIIKTAAQFNVGLVFWFMAILDLVWFVHFPVE
jgi:uncharacterized membrane protein